VVLFALKELAGIKDPSKTRAKQLLVMLHYVFWAAVMPPFAAMILDELVGKVYKELSAAEKANKPLDLGWLHVEPVSVNKILRTLTWWRAEGKTAVDFRSALPTRLLVFGSLHAVKRVCFYGRLTFTFQN
jgi:hypothetical protein